MDSPAYLWVFGVSGAVSIACAVTWLVFKSLGEPVDLNSNPTRRFATIVSVVFSWLALVMLLGASGIFQGTLHRYVPYIAFAITLPLAVGCWFLLGTRHGAQIVLNLPIEWAIGIQTYRSLGSIFLLLSGLSLLPSEFAIPAGFGDTITGVLAIPVAAYYFSGLPARKMVAVIWNLFGIADLVVAIAIGFLTSPSPLQLLARDHPNLLISQFPLVLIPAFAVPILFLLHIATLKKLIAHP